MDEYQKILKKVVDCQDGIFSRVEPFDSPSLHNNTPYRTLFVAGSFKLCPYLKLWLVISGNF